MMHNLIYNQTETIIFTIIFWLVSANWVTYARIS
jgi:hypothetical protein